VAQFLANLLLQASTAKFAWPTYQESTVQQIQYRYLSISFRSANVIGRTRSMMFRIVCFYIEYSLLLFIVLWTSVDQSKCTSSVVRTRCHPKEYNSVRSLSNPPLRVFYERCVLGFGSIRRWDTPIDWRHLHGS
jgi:hypothetical protein